MFRHLLAAAAFALVACSGGDDGAEETTHDHDDHEHHTDTDVDLSTEKMTDGGSFMVAYSTMGDIPLNEDFMLMVELSDMEGNPVQATMVDVDATMPQHGHGMNQEPSIMDMGDGMWHADGMRFHMEGYWELVVEVDGEMAVFDVDCCGASAGTM